MRKLLLITLLLVLFAGRAFAVSAPQLYVGNYAGGSGGAILSWPPSTTGNVSPTTNITGATTTIGGSSGVAIDAGGHIWAADYTNSKILKFSAGTTGNVAPTITITPTRNNPKFLAFDSNGYLYVTSGAGAQVDIYSPSQLTSTGSPIPNTLTGNTTTINLPASVAIGPGNKIYVADDAASGLNAVLIFAASTAGGNVAPIATIAGSNTGFGTSGVNSVTGVGIDAAGNVYVNDNLNEIFIFNSGNTGNVAPNTTIVGASTLLNGPQGIAVDASGNIYVANNGGPSITVYSSGASGNATPAQNISGANTLLNSPYQLIVWPTLVAAKGFFFAP